ncbi:ABC transporter permease [Paenibacillus oceani]|uniref:ABC transporter permease n=1 Tax=Paenibacillus oceani TaxID=2772510 RepID=A0A927C901_9BACL|nr:ABC transporter permease subunit [Paenibacillus oceani]MBD2862313.1 ABC transporter permease [Paenibacillus oceani]
MSYPLLAGMGRLIGFIVRLDRMRVPLWMLGIAFFTLIVPPALSEIYGSQQERDVMAGSMANPAMTAMLGPGELDNYTIGAMTAHQMLLLTALVVGLMAILLVARHTRGDEEEGRMELVRSLPVGRLSWLNATLVVQVGIFALLAAVTGIGLTMLGVESMDLEGSLLYGVILGATGLVFAGVAALFAQLSDNSRGTIGYSIAVLLISYLVRAAGDVGNETLSWLSPLGWVTKAGVYSVNNWGVVALMTAFALLLFIVANGLHAIRDLDRGFIPSRPGRSRASRFLQSPIALVFRLQRTGLFAWAIGMYVLGASYGSILGDLEGFLGNNEMAGKMLGEAEGLTITEQFIALLMTVMTLAATIPPILVVNRLRGEEKKGLIDPLLGRAVSRDSLLGSYLLAAIVIGFVMVLLAVLGLWSAGNASMENGLNFGTIYGAAAVYYPAILVMIGISVLFTGCFPKMTTVNWLYLIYSFVVLFMGGLLQLPDWMKQVTPYGYVPRAPVEDVTFLPLFVLGVIAIVLITAGFVGFRRRDMETL